MPEKVIKDSVHGYITLRDDFIPIVDSAEFQRLKWIEQGSFRILYPAARHDRFIHSLGTYHLANQFSKHFIENIKNDIDIKIKDKDLMCIENTFLYAALLHDIGHAPFSHTCENFFKNITVKIERKIIKKIEYDLIKAVASIPKITKVSVKYA